MSRCTVMSAPFVVFASLGVMALAAVAAAAGPAWPPFLPTARDLPGDVVVRVGDVWKDPTLTRKVAGARAPVPLHVYLAFFDTPDVTAGAARHLALAPYQVRVLGEGRYEANDGAGSRGEYRVLVREHGRRVLLSHGQHAGRIGTVTGSALTVLDFAGVDGGVEPTLTAYVRLDDRLMAGLARLLAPIFGRFADRELRRSFAVAGEVARWALVRPSEFCAWLADAPFDNPRRQRVLSALPPCPA